MRYERDETAVRSAQEEKRKAEDDIKISALEKEIKIRQEKMELIDKEIKKLEEEREEQNKYFEELIENTQLMYDQMIKDTEAYWDAIIEGLEGIKSKWEELAEIETIGKAWGELGPVLEELGFTVEDVLNDTPGAFEAFKAAYVDALANANAENKHFIQGLQDASGQTIDNLSKIEEAAANTEKHLSGMGDSAGAISDTATAAGELDKSLQSIDQSAGEAVSKLSGIAQVDYSTIASNLGNIADQIQNLTGIDLSNISQPLKDISTAVDEGLTGRITTITYALQQLMAVTLQALADNAARMHDALDEATATNTSNIRNSISLLSTTELGQLIGQLAALKQIVSDTATLLGVGEEAALGGINSALTMLTSIDLQPLIDQFTSLQEAITNVTAAITGEGGTGGQEGTAGAGREEGGGEGEGESSGLVKAIEDVKTTADENIGVAEDEDGETVIGDFVKLGKAVNSVSSKIGSIDEESEEDITVIGSINDLADVTAEKLPEITDAFNELREVVEAIAEAIAAIAAGIGNISLNAGGTTPWYTGTAHANGTALLSGDWGTKKTEKALVGELGPELLVTPNGHYQTVGDNGPEIRTIPKDSIIFNSKQTAEILNKKNQIGHSYAQGTLPHGFSPLTDDTYSTLALKIKEGGLPTMTGIVSALDNQTREIQSTIQNVNTATTNVELNSTFNISGVTGEDVARQINTTLQTTFMGFANKTTQYAKTR